MLVDPAPPASNVIAVATEAILLPAETIWFVVGSMMLFCSDTKPELEGCDPCPTSWFNCAVTQLIHSGCASGGGLDHGLSGLAIGRPHQIRARLHKKGGVIPKHPHPTIA